MLTKMFKLNTGFLHYMKVISTIISNGGIGKLELIPYIPNKST